MPESQTPNNKRKAQQKHHQRPQQRRRRKKGVPTALVAGLLVIAVFFGGILGFVLGNHAGSDDEQIEEYEERITQLENLLAMAGISEDADAESFTFGGDDDEDDTDASAEFGDLSGESSTSDDVVWNSDGLSGSLLTDTGEEIVVAEFDGGEVLSTEVIEPYNEQITNLAFSFGDTDETDTSEILQSVLESLVTEKLAYLKAEELGLTELTDEEIAAIEAEVQDSYDEQVSFYASYVDTDGMTDEEAEAAIAEYIEEEIGLSLDDMIEDEKESYWKDKLYNEIVKDVTVTDEELQEAYDSLVESQQELFTESPDDYVFAVLAGEVVAYNPEGYRRVKQILLPFEDFDTITAVEDLIDQIDALDAETDLEEIETLNDELDTYFEELDAQAEDILAQIADGADFDELIEQYGTADDYMTTEPTKSFGYPVSADSTNSYYDDFVEASMMLTEVGDVSVAVLCPDGVHIIKYIGDVTAGAVDLEEIRDELTAEVLEEKQQEYYAEQEAEWLENANAVYYPDRLQ